MRISDWSSDVCSSDLDQPAGRQDGIAAVVRLAGMRRLALHAGLEEAAALVAVDDAHVGRLADDHHLRRRKVLRNVVDHPADTGAADLLVSTEDRRVGTGGVRTCRVRWTRFP